MYKVTQPNKVTTYFLNYRAAASYARVSLGTIHVRLLTNNWRQLPLIF